MVEMLEIGVNFVGKADAAALGFRVTGISPAQTMAHGRAWTSRQCRFRNGSCSVYHDVWNAGRRLFEYLNLCHSFPEPNAWSVRICWHGTMHGRIASDDTERNHADIGSDA